MASALKELMRILQLEDAQAGRAAGPSALLAMEPGLAKGGQAPSGLSSLVAGPGGGQDDIVPALLAPGEFVFDAETVAMLGDGSTEQGARKLEELRQRLRRHKRGAPDSKIPPKAKRPEQYMKGK